MSKLKRVLTALAVVFCFGAVWAATPVAVWDGGNTDLGSFSLAAQNGNTIENNVITIASEATGGVVYTGPNNSLNNCTFIIRCSGLDFANANNQYLLSLHQNMLGGGNGDASYNKVGVSLAANNAAVRGIWQNAFYDDDGGSLQVADPFSAGTDIVINIQTSGGVFAYEIVTDANTGARTLVKRFGHTGLKASQTNYKGFSLGGIYEKASSTLSPATGWTISKMAVFGSTLSEAEILGYAFPSDIDTIPVNANTTVSALNALIAASSGARIILSVADGVEIDVDTAFVASVPVEVASSGSITLSANAQPAASYFSAVSFGGVQGAVKRTWMANPGVVGFNFNANGGRNGQGNTDGAADTALALEIGTWYKDAYSPSGSSTAMFADGLSLLTWQANNVYAEAGDLTAGTFIQGYLDDGGNVSIKLSAVPYETYDVIIYCSTDDSSKSFKAKTVNDTIYTWDATAGETTTTSSDTATWGLASAAAGKAVYGANTLRINNLTGPLSIKGGTNGNNARGCISAIQIMPAGTSTAPEMTVGTAGQTTQATWTGATWNVASAPTSGNVVINVSGDVELTIDKAVALSAITVTGEGSLKIIPDQANSVTFTASSISSSAVPLIFANDGIGIATISASVTYLYKTTSINSSTYGNTYTAGVGAQGSSVAISHNGGSVTLQGATYYLGESHNDTATTVTFDDATAVYADCGVGMATYSVEGSSSITAQRLILSQGAAGRTAVMTVKDTASINVTGTSDVDSNQASIMFGHWNGPSTFTIQDSATFTAASQVLVGKTANNHTININGGTFTARGIKMAGYASGTNTLNLNGGLLVLGDVGITSYGSTTISVNVLDDSEIRASAATLPISQAVTIAADKVLSFTKDSGVEGAVVTLTGAVSGTGGISVGAGVTLNLGTNRPEGEISVDADGAIAVVMTSKVDVPVLKVSSKPANVVLYDTDGTTELSGATVDYDAEAGTITVKPPVNTWNVSENLSFDTEANWSSGLPESTQDTAIKVTGDAALTIAGTYEAATLTVSGSGVVEFSGEGSFTVGTLYLNGGATLAPDSKVSASSIVLASGTVLRLKDKTESAPISGAGAVETYGAVTFNANNTFTGGLTVKSGSEAKTIKTGIGGQAYGKNNYGQAIANLSRIVVEDGGSLDLANTADACYAITISGKGVYDAQSGVYKGALYNSGSEIGQNTRQTASLTLTADAMVKAEASNNGWGLVNSGHAATVLALNGHTLTVSGAGYFPIVNANTASGTQTTGTLVADGVTLGLVSTACNLTGVDVIAKGCASIKIETAPSALGSLTVKPSASGTTASAWTLPSSPLPIVDTSNIDTTGLTDGQVLTIFTAPNATELSSATISVQTSTRFTSELDGNLVKVTFNAGMPANFMHYDFDNGAAVNTGKAADSGTQISSVGEAGSATLVDSKNGQAVQVHTGYTPYWDTLANDTSPFHAGAVTVTTVAKMKQTGVILWGLGNTNNSNPAMGLAVLDSTTAAVYARTTSGTVEKVVEVSGTEDLTKGYHFYAVVATATGTTLYVDNLSQSSDKGVSSKIGQMGQLGSFHGGVIGSEKVGADGYYLDDWRIYDTALTTAEVASLRSALTYVTVTVPSVENATVTVKVGEDTIGIAAGNYDVAPGSVVTVTYAAADGYQISGTTVYTINTANSETTFTPSAQVALIVAYIGETPYTDLATAFSAVDDDETLTLVGTAVTLATDVTVAKSYTLAGDAQGTTVTGAGKIYLTGSAELTLDATLTSVGNQFWFSSKNAKLTFPTEGFTPNVRPYTAGGCQTGTTVNGDGTTTYYQYLFLTLQVGASNVTLAYADTEDPLVTKQVYEGDEIVFTATPAEGYENVVVTANSEALTPVDGKYTVVVGTVNVAIQATASAMPTVTLPNMTGTHMTVKSVTANDVTVEANLDGTYSVPSGSTVVVTFEVEEGGYFVDGNTITIEGVVADTTVTAESLPAIAPYVAEINGTPYKTLAAAVAAAVNGDTIKLCEDIELDARVEPNVGAGTTIVIDLDHKTITRTGTSGNGSVFDVKSGTVTIKNGTIDCTQDDTAIVADGVYAITARSGSAVTLEGLTVTVDSQAGACAYPFTGATLTIKSGTYRNNTAEEYQYKTGWTGMAVNQANVTDKLLTIEGGRFWQVNPEEGDDSGKVTNFLAAGRIAKLQDGYWVVQAGTWVATVGGTKYETLAAAVAGATTGDTVKLLTDVTLDARVEPNLGTGTTLTIDLNEKTITRTGTSGNGSVFDVKSGTVTIKNGTIDCTQDDTAIVKDGVYAITARSGSAITLEDLTITVDSQAGACVYPFTGAAVTINSGTYRNNTAVEYQYKTGWTGMAVNQANVATQLITIYGGYFWQVNPAEGDDSGLCTTFLASGYESNLVEGYWVVTEKQDVPVEPGAQSDPVDTEEEAEAIAEKTVIEVPEAVAEKLNEDQATAYAQLFEAKVVEVPGETTKYAVEVVLKPAVETALQTVVDAEASDLAEAAVEAAANAQAGGEAEVTTTPGLYYVVEAGTSIGGIVPVDCVLATGTTTKLTIPNKGTSGFYKIKVSVTPVATTSNN